MPVVVSCPHCTKRLGVPENGIGKTVKCPHCTKPFVAQAAPPAAPPAPAPAPVTARAPAAAPPPVPPVPPRPPAPAPAATRVPAAPPAPPRAAPARVPVAVPARPAAPPVADPTAVRAATAAPPPTVLPAGRPAPVLLQPIAVDVEDESAVVVYPPGRQPRQAPAPARPAPRPEAKKRFPWLIVSGAGAGVLVVIVVVLLLLLKSSPEAARIPAEAWQEYVSPTGEYRVMMPGVPEVRPSKNVTMAGVVRDAKENGFFVYHGPLPPLPPDRLFDSNRDGVLKKFPDSRVINERPINYEGHPGREFEIDAPGKGNIISRVYAIQGPGQPRFFGLLVSGEGYRANSADVRRFFDSFQVFGRKDGGDPKQVEPPKKDKGPPPDKEKKDDPEEKGRQYFKHAHDVVALAVRDGGKALLTATEDGEVARWDVAGQRKVRSTRVVVKSGGFGALAVPADGPTVAVTVGQGLVRVLDLEGGKAEIDLQPEKLGGFNQIAAAYSPDGRLLATGYGQEVKVWDVNGRRQLFELKGHGGYILSLVFSPDGRTLAVSCGDQKIKLWDAETGKEKGSLVGHKPPEAPFDGYRTMQWNIRSLAFSPDGAMLASASNDKTVIVWDVAKRQSVKVLPHHECVLAVAFAKDGKRLASGTSDGKVYLWETAGWQERRRLDMPRNDAVRALAFLPDGERLAVAAGRNVIVQTLGKE